VDVSSERGPRRGTDQDIKLEEIMHPAVTITPDASKREALKVLLENKFLVCRWSTKRGF
jgi:CBS domain-containing protein